MSKKGSPFKHSKREVSNLLSIASNPARDYFSTVGVILDCTGSYKTDDSLQYVTKLKIIDNSFNSLTKDGLKVNRYILVFLYSDDGLFDGIHNIGDILILRDFSYDTYEGTVKAVYNKKESEWHVYDGRENASFNTILARSKSSVLSPPSKNEIEKIQELREWKQIFFTNNSITSMNWFSKEFPKNIVDSNIYELKDVDLLVKVLKISNSVIDRQNYSKIIFVDEKGVLFFSELKKSEISFGEGQIVKLRSVCIYLYNGGRKIDFYNYSNILHLQPQWKDSRILSDRTSGIQFSAESLENTFFEEMHLEKYFKINEDKAIIYTTKDTDLKSHKIQSIESKFPILAKFHIPSNYNKKSSIGSFISKQYSNYPVKSFDDLSDILNGINSKKANFRTYKDNVMRVKGKITKIEPSRAEDFIKFYSSKKNKIWSFNEKEMAIKSSKSDLQVMFQIKFTICEDKTSNILSVNLASYNGNPSYFFDLSEIVENSSNVEEWRSITKDKLKKLTDFVNQLKNNKTFDFIVRLTESADKSHYLKIEDTIVA